MEQDLRQCLRINKDYSITYAPLVNLKDIDKNSKEARLCDISAGGIAFEAEEGCKKGDQFLLKISFKGWKKDGTKIVPCDRNESCFFLKAITEIVRVRKIRNKRMFRIAGKFMGRCG
jgi:c-di-GMP-binding flagellar brake protein YcgR